MSSHDDICVYTVDTKTFAPVTVFSKRQTRHLKRSQNTMETTTKNPFYTTKTVQLKYYLTKNDRLNEKLQHWTGVCKDISVCNVKTIKC